MIRMEGIVKRYARAQESGTMTVLTIDRLSIALGEEVNICGPSGSGKTTLLHLIAGILLPSQGKIWIGDTELTALSQARRDLFRAQNVGCVFQDFSLIPSLTARENVMCALSFGKKIPRAQWQKEADLLLERVGLSHLLSHRPAQLSGGEQQRVCIARALANRPPIMIADEPTANLDEGNRDKVMKLIRDTCKADGLTLVLATHNLEILKPENRIIRLGDKAEGGEPLAAAHSME